MLSSEETVLLLILSFGVIGIPIASFLKKDYVTIWSPIVFVCVVYFYYAIIGPLNAIIKDDTTFRVLDHRSYYSLALLACNVSFYSILIGFHSNRRKENRNEVLVNASIYKLQKNGIILIAISIFLFTIFSGGDITSRINFLDTSRDSQDFQGSFAAYLMLSINFLIVGVCLILYNQVKRKKIIIFILSFFLAASIFINEAFRYRLVVLVVAVFTAYHLYLKKKPKILLLAAVVIPFFLLMGVLEVSRRYGRGIEVERLEGKDYTELTESGLNETAVFWASGYFMEEALDKYGYTYFDFISNAVASPIPRAIWPSKPDGSYILQTNDLYGTYGTGQAYLNFCEYYLAFGWPGIIICSFLLGFFLKKAWLWFLVNKDNPLAITAISVLNGFVYVLISRNYTTQHVTLFFFTVYPAFFIIWLYKKGYLKP